MITEIQNEIKAFKKIVLAKKNFELFHDTLTKERDRDYQFELIITITKNFIETVF
jgi:hypothetical protein